MCLLCGIEETGEEVDGGGVKAQLSWAELWEEDGGGGAGSRLARRSCSILYILDILDSSAGRYGSR